MPPALRLHYGNKKPVALRDLTKSLNAFADEYRATQKRNATTFEEDKAELFITRVESGSIIAEMMPYAAVGLSMVEHVNSTADLMVHLKNGVDFLKGLGGSARRQEKKTVENLMKIVEPVARENGTQLNIQGGVHINNLTINITTEEAREMQHTGKVYLQRLKAPRVDTVDRVKLYWFQARNSKTSTGDRALIPEIWDKPVKVMFSTDRIKAQILDDESNPFRNEYLVDVIVDSQGDKPKLYRIVKVHGSRRGSRTARS